MRAIDALKYLFAKAESEVPEGHRIVGLNVPVDIVREIIDAQPEIVRCKDCIKRDYCRTTNVWAVPPADDWYCGDARREE